MRYPLILAILCLLIAALPFEKVKKGESRRDMLVGEMLSADQQESAAEWLANETASLRAMPPLHQLLVLTTGIILLVNAAVLLSYLINSVAAIAGIGLSMTVFVPLLALALISLIIGWRTPRTRLIAYMKKHAEFGPFLSKFSTRLWRKRFRRAAAEHGFASQY